MIYFKSQLEANIFVLRDVTTKFQSWTKHIVQPQKTVIREQKN